MNEKPQRGGRRPGVTRTAPAGDVSECRFAVVSCSSYPQQHNNNDQPIESAYNGVLLALFSLQYIDKKGLFSVLGCSIVCPPNHKQSKTDEK